MPRNLVSKKSKGGSVKKYQIGGAVRAIKRAVTVGEKLAAKAKLAKVRTPGMTLKDEIAVEKSIGAYRKGKVVDPPQKALEKRKAIQQKQIDDSYKKRGGQIKTKKK